jgi:hypothetical protein
MGQGRSYSGVRIAARKRSMDSDRRARLTTAPAMLIVALARRFRCPGACVKSLAVSPSASAEVLDCIDLSQALLYVAKTGALKDSTPGGRHLIDAGLVMRDGVWKVSTMAAGRVGSC